MVDAAVGATAARALPVVLLGLLLVASVWWDSAFDLRYWAPLTILALALMLVQLLTGAIAIPRRGPLAVATAAIWCFAAYVLLTAAWSDSAAGAWLEAGRSVFYAAVWTLAVGAGLGGGWRSRLGGALTVGIVVVALATVVGLIVDGSAYFLAGRLDSPIGYRNATAALFAFGVWPLVGQAARHGNAAAVRAAAFAAVVLMLGLAFLTQSRGVLIGLVLGGAVSLAIGPDRLRRAWVAIGALAAVAVFSSDLLAPYDAFTEGVFDQSDQIATATRALLLATALSFVVGGLLFVLDSGLRSTARIRAVAVALLAVFAVGAGVVGIAKVGNPVDYADTKLTEFNDVEPASTGGSTRLGSVGGQRSDLWRVAWDEFKADPLAGAGAGSYRFAYYRDRHTDRNLDNPHSLPLRLLSETGLIGFLLFLAWLVAVALAIARRAQEAERSERIWIAGLAAAGATILTQCLADWLWLLPGLLGLGFLALGLAAGGDGEPGSGAPGGGAARWRHVAAGGVAAALVGVAFLFLGNLYVRDARVAAADSPQEELSDARVAAWFNPVSVTPLYLQASALESMGRRAEARGRLEDALDREPENFVTIGLLGDFEYRGGNFSAARGYYRQALALNPLDSGLRKLSESDE